MIDDAASVRACVTPCSLAGTWRGRTARPRSPRRCGSSSRRRWPPRTPCPRGRRSSRPSSACARQIIPTHRHTQGSETHLLAVHAVAVGRLVDDRANDLVLDLVHAHALRRLRSAQQLQGQRDSDRGKGRGRRKVRGKDRTGLPHLCEVLAFVHGFSLVGSVLLRNLRWVGLGLRCMRYG